MKYKETVPDILLFLKTFPISLIQNAFINILLTGVNWRQTWPSIISSFLGTLTDDLLNQCCCPGQWQWGGEGAGRTRDWRIVVRVKCLSFRLQGDQDYSETVGVLAKMAWRRGPKKTRKSRYFRLVWTTHVHDHWSASYPWKWQDLGVEGTSLVDNRDEGYRLKGERIFVWG